MASGKNMATSHLGAVGRDLDSSAGWGLGLVAGYKGLAFECKLEGRAHTAPRWARTRPGPRARKEVGNEHTQSIRAGQRGRGGGR